MGAFESITYLHPNTSLANEAIRACALRPEEALVDAGASNLGISHTTPMQLVASEWELWGDGRAFASDAYRLMQVYRLLEPHGLQLSLGTAMQVSMLLKRHLHAMESVGFSVPGLSASEEAVCALARDYCDTMGAHNVIELCQALPLIEDDIMQMDIRMAEPCILDEPLRSFFDRKGGPFRNDDPIPLSQGLSANGTAEFELLRPQGVTAVERMVLDEAKRAIGNGSGSVAIVAPDAVAAYTALAPSLRREGVACSIDAGVPFGETSFGRFYLSACKLFALASCFGVEGCLEPEDVTWVDAATDVALSEYAGIAPFESSVLRSTHEESPSRTLRAADLNSVWRADRTLAAVDAVRDLMAVSAGFQRLEVVFSANGNPQAALARFAEEAKRLHAGLDAQIESSAVAAVRSLLDTATELGCATSYMAIFPFGMAFPLCVAEECDEAEDGILGEPGSKPYAAFVSYGNASHLAPASFDETILCDATDAHLNATEPTSSIASIASKLGAQAKGAKLERSRAAFASVLKAARSRFACVFPVLDANADESFTSFALDEFVERRFDGSLKPADVMHGQPEDGRLAEEVREFLREHTRSVGEDDLASGIGHRFDEPASEIILPVAERGSLGYLQLDGFLPSADIDGAKLAIISPSAIEAYLACPYKWFAEKVLRPEALDEGFGTLEAGNFAHELLRRFYTRLLESKGADRLTEVDPGEAWDIFKETADCLLADQFRADPLSGRYVPVTNVEMLSAGNLIADVYKSAIAYSALPDDMSISDMELSIGRAKDGRANLPYAGFALNGKVDRVDVGDGGFAVIDYKGSIANHAAGSSTVFIEKRNGMPWMDPEILPRHVQSLVYAKALLDVGKHGGECRGALYVSYRCKSPLRMVAGSYQAEDKEIAAISEGSSAVYIDLGEFAALIERALRERLSGIYESRIPVDPSYADACRYCCIESCEGGKGWH